jgi:Site-specific recombinase XerC
MKPVPPSRPQPSIVDGLHDQDARLSAIRQLLIDCEARPGRLQNKIALRLLALTAVRPGELAGARWEEFVDLEGENPFWVIPAARMKGQKVRKKEHFVPLARQTVELLAVLRRLNGRFALCFPSERHIHRTISENTLRQILINAGYYQKHVPHGFRAAFSTYMNERSNELNQIGDRQVIDLMLAHTSKSYEGADRRAATISNSEAAYNRALYMPRRKQLAQEWADILLADFWSLDVQIHRPIR